MRRQQQQRSWSHSIWVTYQVTKVTRKIYPKINATRRVILKVSINQLTRSILNCHLKIKKEHIKQQNMKKKRDVCTVKIKGTATKSSLLFIYFFNAHAFHCLVIWGLRWSRPLKFLRPYYHNIVADIHFKGSFFFP